MVASHLGSEKEIGGMNKSGSKLPRPVTRERIESGSKLPHTKTERSSMILPNAIPRRRRRSLKLTHYCRCWAAFRDFDRIHGLSSRCGVRSFIWEPKVID
jgi:hypothetical protein